MKFDHLDDPTPRPGDLATVTTAARRRTTRRRATAATGVLSVALVGGAWAAVARDPGREVVAEPATTTSAGPTAAGVARFTTSEGLEIEMTLPYSQAVPGGPVAVAFDVTNPTDHTVNDASCLFENAPHFTLEGRDGNPSSISQEECLGTPETWSGDPREYPIARGETISRTFTIDATHVGRSREPLPIGDYSVTLRSQGHDGTVLATLPIEIVGPVGHSEVAIDTTLGAGQVVDPVLVVHNDLDALVPFPGAGETCQWVSDRFVLAMQGQFVAPGAEPEPFAWPGVDCTGLELRPYPMLRPGANEVAIGTVDGPPTPGTYELVVDLGYEWPPGISGPERVTVTVTSTDQPISQGFGP